MSKAAIFAVCTWSVIITKLVFSVVGGGAELDGVVEVILAQHDLSLFSPKIQAKQRDSVWLFDSLNHTTTRSVIYFVML